ncbi:MAG: hypothetical protein M1825_004741 [Sarcosagium campestre]|nr:MAG: hypothetical protein M1825_004741 [Sarcosagium campestre]
MSDKNSPPPSPSYPRRASFSPGQTLSGMFSRSPNATSPAFPGPITSAAASAQTRRRLSVSTLGLSGSSPTQTSPFGPTGASRRESTSSSNSGGIIDESAIEEEGPEGASTGSIQSTPTTPFARRMSFGARALRDVRSGGGSAQAGNGRATSSTSKSSPPSAARARGEGFNWSENLRSRAERTSSVSGTGAAAAVASHQRSATTSSMPPPAQEVPAKQASRVPDAMQERILKGDFYMD